MNSEVKTTACCVCAHSWRTCWSAVSLCLLLLIGGTVLSAAQTKDVQISYQPLGKLVDIGGYRLHLNCSGESDPTVVLIAGSGDFSFDWSLIQPDLSRFARVCSYDRAGFAWSDPGPTPRTMQQDAYELHKLLGAARIKGPFVLVGHSLGGLIARVYAAQYPEEVAGLVLVDPTHEETTLMLQGKLVRIRDYAKGLPIPPVQTMKSSPPQPATKDDIDQFEFNQKMFGAPKIETPFDKLPTAMQAMRVWFLAQSPRSAAGPDYWAEELQVMYVERSKRQYQLGDVPLLVLLPPSGAGAAPQGIADDQWKRVNDEKRQQKLALTNLSRNAKLIIAPNSGHHIQLDNPGAVTSAVRQVVDAVKRHTRLALGARSAPGGDLQVVRRYSYQVYNSR